MRNYNFILKARQYSRYKMFNPHKKISKIAIGATQRIEKMMRR